jgi:hypothetical protein
MGRSRWDVNATAGQRRPAPIENLALVPASLLPHKTTYQRLANQLPAGAVLVVLPTEDTPERRTLQETAARLRAKGHAIALLSADEVLAQAGRRRTPQPGSGRPRPVTAPPPPDPGPVVAAAPSAAPATAGPAGTAVPPFTRELRLVRIDPGAAPARFEIYQWQPTLWGGVALVRLRGVLGQPPHAQTVLEAETPHQDEVVTALVRRRLRAGYRIADWQ